MNDGSKNYLLKDCRCVKVFPVLRAQGLFTFLFYSKFFVQILKSYTAEHVQIATTINEKIKKESLNDIGKLEQDFVYGEATSKDLLSMISSKQVH